MITQMDQPVAQARWFHFSRTELLVLQLARRGYSNREIGSLVGVSEADVEAALTRLARELGASTRTEALDEAQRRGLIV